MNLMRHDYEWKPNKRNRNVVACLDLLRSKGFIAQWDRNRSGIWFVRKPGVETWTCVGNLGQIEAYCLGATHVRVRLS